MAQVLRQPAPILAIILLGIVAPFARCQDTPPVAANLSNIRVVIGFECASRLQCQILGPDHILITLDDSVSLDGWLFRLENVAGKTVHIDIACTQSLAKWKSLNPMYAAAGDLNDPALYVAGPSTGQTTTAARVKLPDTNGQKWHYISDAKLVKKTFTMTQTFDSDAVWIANRVPYTPVYNEKFLHGLDKNPLAKVTEIGRSSENRPLLLVQIGGDDAAAKTKATVVIAGGEQATQPDGMWSAQGAIEFLLGDTDSAKRLRDHCRFLIIPMLDPDGTAAAEMRLLGAFRPIRGGTRTAIAWANFFQKWILDGNRLDAVFEIHNVQSHEYPHLSRAFIENGPVRGPLAEALNDAVVAKFKAADLLFSPKTQTTVVFPARFGAWLSANYGPVLVIYEINAQDPTRHLDLAQLKATGGLFAESAGDFLFTPKGTELLAAVDAVRERQQAVWTSNPATQPTQNALESEAAIRPSAAPGQTEPNGL